MQVGDSLPLFTLPDQDWNDFHSVSLLGKPCVIFFYPKDESLGCTKEACSFRDHFDDFKDLDTEVIGISGDTPDDHRNFKEKHNLPFTLLCDRKSEVRKIFNVSSSVFGILPGRVTFVFDAKGNLLKKYDSQVAFEKHVLKALDALE